jgi:hypothetical protein
MKKFDIAQLLIALHILLSPFVLATVAHWVIHSDFNGLIEMDLSRDGGKVILDRRTPPTVPENLGNDD